LHREVESVRVYASYHPPAKAPQTNSGGLEPNALDTASPVAPPSATMALGLVISNSAFSQGGRLAASSAAVPSPGGARSAAEVVYTR
jgi:hypothetical protein